MWQPPCSTPSHVYKQVGNTSRIFRLLQSVMTTGHNRLHIIDPKVGTLIHIFMPLDIGPGKVISMT